MFHKNPEEIDRWMKYLSQHCQYYQAEEILNFSHKLGDGHFAEVFQAKHKFSGQICAVKKINKEQLTPKTMQY